MAAACARVLWIIVCLFAVAGGEANAEAAKFVGSSSYAQYMKQYRGDLSQYMQEYAGDYHKYMSGSNASAAAKAHFMKQYASAYQKYMSSAEPNTALALSASSTSKQSDAGSNYRQYMQQYAGNYMKKYAGDYQKYMDRKNASAEAKTLFMKKYAGDYTDAAESMALAATASSSMQSGSGSAYEKYMRQYVAGGNPQSGGYGQYVKQYASDYLHGSNSSVVAAAKTQYMRRYAGNYQKFMGGYGQYVRQYAAASQKYLQGGGTSPDLKSAGDAAAAAAAGSRPNALRGTGAAADVASLQESARPEKALGGTAATLGAFFVVSMFAACIARRRVASKRLAAESLASSPLYIRLTED